MSGSLCSPGLGRPRDSNRDAAARGDWLFGTTGNSHVKLVSSINSEEARGTDSPHVWVTIQCHELADGLRIASKVTLPEAIAPKGCSRTAAEVVFARSGSPLKWIYENHRHETMKAASSRLQ